MPNVKPSPTSVRYLKARLTVLKRPTVWISSSLFMAAMVLLVEYWTEPQQFATTQPDDRPIATDLLESESSSESSSDFSVLTPLDPYSSVDESTVGDVATWANTEPPTADSLMSDRLADDLTWLNAPADLEALLLNPLFASASIRSRPVASETEFVSPRWDDRSPPSEALRPTGLSVDAAERVESSQTSAMTSAVTAEQLTSSSSNPLQAAIDRQKLANAQRDNAVDSAALSAALSAELSAAPSPLSNPTESTSGDRTTPATAPFSWPQPAHVVQPQPLPGQPASLQTQPYPQFLPQTSPAPGTTGYTLPPALRTPTGFGSIDMQSSEYRPSAVQPAQPTVNAVPPEPSPPFSIPRAVPGRSIGGGEVNTFSNP